MKKALLVITAVLALISFVQAGEIHRPTNWASTSGSVSNVASAADGNDDTFASAGPGWIKYTGFGAASSSVARLQLHIRWDCTDGYGDGWLAGCHANVSTDGGASWVTWNNYSPMPSTYGSQSLTETVVDLEPGTDLTKVVVYVSGDEYYDPGYICNPVIDGPDCIDTPPSDSWGVMHVRDIWLDATLGTPQKITLRGSPPTRNNPPNTLQFCYGIKTYSTSSDLSAAYDNDPVSRGYVYGEGGWSKDYACSASYVAGYPALPANTTSAKLTVTWSCTASMQYWSLCDYGTTFNAGSNWRNIAEGGNGSSGTYSAYLNPTTDLTSFWVGIGAKAKDGGYSYAYISDARLDVYTAPLVTPAISVSCSPSTFIYGTVRQTAPPPLAGEPRVISLGQSTALHLGTPR